MLGKQQRGSCDGFILYAVLSVTALLSVLFLSLSLQARSAVDTATITNSELDTDALLQSGVNLAGYQLFVAKLSSANIDGQQIRFGSGIVTLSVLDRGGQVDLNGASLPLLEAAYRATGLRTLTPATFAARVIDWRDSDDEAEKDGAEAAQYRAAGVSFEPRNGDFRQVSDLKWVLGISPSDVQALASFVTIYNPAGRLDVKTADISLLAALPGMTKLMLEKVDALRKSSQDTTAEDYKSTLAELAPLFDFDPPISYVVMIEARPRGTSLSFKAVSNLIASVDRSRAFQVVSWRRLTTVPE